MIEGIEGGEHDVTTNDPTSSSSRADDGSSSSTASTKPDLIYGAIVGTLYVLAVSVQVYLVVDEVTHGALSDDLRRRWARVRAAWDQHRRIDREVRKWSPWVLWEAHQALEREEAP